MLRQKSQKDGWKCPANRQKNNQVASAPVAKPTHRQGRRVATNFWLAGGGGIQTTKTTYLNLSFFSDFGHLIWEMLKNVIFFISVKKKKTDWNINNFRGRPPPGASPTGGRGGQDPALLKNVGDDPPEMWIFQDLFSWNV